MNLGNSELRVGFIGLGSQGGPMARRIVEAGYRTTLWDSREAGLQAYVDTPAVLARSAAEVGAASDVVGVCVVDDAGVKEVLTGANGLLASMAPGSVVAIHSTVHPDTCRAMADAAGEYGVAVIDAAVSGGGSAAQEGHLLVMVGGAEDDVARCRPVFETYGDPIIHLGPVGAGQVAKLLNNTLFAAHLATDAAAIELGLALGVDANQLCEVMSHGSGASFALASVGRVSGDIALMGSTAGPLLRKDVGLLAAIAPTTAEGASMLWHAADNALARMGQAR